MPSKEILLMPPDICQNIINIYQKRRKITKNAQIICVYHFFTNFVAEFSFFLARLIESDYQSLPQEETFFFSIRMVFTS